MEFYCINDVESPRLFASVRSVGSCKTVSVIKIKPEPLAIFSVHKKSARIIYRTCTEVSG
jgi:hypothetical protein